ncbi:MAG: spore germination protein [Clostridia bacterium]|nr:spore germination protein [Clostridia bacterium]
MNIQKKIEHLKQKFSQTSDFATRELVTKSGENIAIVWIENVVDQLLLAQSVIAPLQDINLHNKNADIFTIAKEKMIAFSKLSEPADEKTFIESLLNGFVGILFENSEKTLIVECAKWIVRLPAEPPTSAVVEGPREGFVEDIITNMALLRKRLKTPNLVIDKLKIGEETNSQIRIIYLKDVADPKIVNKVKKKLEEIEIDGIVDSHYLSEFLMTGKHTIFKQIGSTEKPDIATAKILEGRIAILTDGSPIVLTVPFVLLEDLQSSNDYYTTPARATLIRYLRLTAGIIGILLPGLYVALLTYHIKAIPIKLLITITNSIQGIPLPPLLEVIFIIFLFEILYEASLRMPRYMGLSLSVVGALILGDTAVKAGLVSPPAVLIVAITGVMSYTLPEQSSQLSFLRLIFTILGGFLGIFGIIVGILFLIGYLVNMDSYGAPYLAPFAPYIKADQKDGLYRKTFMRQRTRPFSLQNNNKRRQSNDGTDE